MADVNQVRGLADLEELSALRSLEFLSLYGLPRVEAIPDLRRLDRLRHAALGSLKGLRSLAGLAAAPNLAELHFHRTVNVTGEDVELLAGHPALEAFDWSDEDIPRRSVEPLVDRLAHLRRPAAVRPEAWLARRLENAP